MGSGGGLGLGGLSISGEGGLRGLGVGEKLVDRLPKCSSPSCGAKVEFLDDRVHRLHLRLRLFSQTTPIWWSRYEWSRLRERIVGVWHGRVAFAAAHRQVRHWRVDHPDARP